MPSFCLPDSASHCIADLFSDNMDGHSDCSDHGVNHDPVHLYDGLECYQIGCNVCAEHHQGCCDKYLEQHQQLYLWCDEYH